LMRWGPFIIHDTDNSSSFFVALARIADVDDYRRRLMYAAAAKTRRRGEGRETDRGRGRGRRKEKEEEEK